MHTAAKQKCRKLARARERETRIHIHTHRQCVKKPLQSSSSSAQQQPSSCRVWHGVRVAQESSLYAPPLCLSPSLSLVRSFSLCDSVYPRAERTPPPPPQPRGGERGEHRRRTSRPGRRRRGCGYRRSRRALWRTGIYTAVGCLSLSLLLTRASAGFLWRRASRSSIASPRRSRVVGLSSSSSAAFRTQPTVTAARACCREERGRKEGGRVDTSEAANFPKTPALMVMHARKPQRINDG